MVIYGVMIFGENSNVGYEIIAKNIFGKYNKNSMD